MKVSQYRKLGALLVGTIVMNSSGPNAHAAPKAAATGARAAMDRLAAAMAAHRVEALANLVSPAKGLTIRGLEVRDTYEDLTKKPKASWAFELLFNVDAAKKGFQAARDLKGVRWVQQGNRFVPARDGHNFKKNEVYILWQQEKSGWKLIEVGTPLVDQSAG